MINFLRKKFGIFTKFESIHLTRIESELGYFAWTLSDDDKLLSSGYADLLIRSKISGVTENGIMTGMAFLDTCSFF